MLLNLRPPKTGDAVRLRCEDCGAVVKRTWDYRLRKKSPYRCASCAAKRARAAEEATRQATQQPHPNASITATYQGAEVLLSALLCDEALLTTLHLSSREHARIVLSRRVQVYGWSWQRALSEPLHQEKDGRRKH